MSSALRPYLTTGMALLSAGLVTIAPVTRPAAGTSALGTRLAANDTNIVDSADQLAGLIVGGSGIPIPQQSASFPDYVQDADALYIQRILPGADSEGVFTPEGAQPIFSGVKSLPLDQSIDQGTFMLNTYITQNVDAGNTVAVYGESQSSMISGYVMDDLKAAGVPADAVKFVLIGDPDNPDGGIFGRLGDGSSGTIPAFGFPLGHPTPADTIYDTTIYTQEYDGFADFPKYPLNILADLNAILGMEFVHPTYRSLPPERIDDAIQLPTSAGYDDETTYYMIPMAQGEIVPLLRPLELIPVIGKPLAALLSPDVQQLINLGYDNPANDGWDIGHADVPTQFGVMPSPDQIATAFANLGSGLQQGTTAAMHELTAEMANPASLLASATAHASDSAATPLSLGDLLSASTSALEQIGALGLPVWDTVLTELITVPQQTIQTFVANLSDPFSAFGLAAGNAVGITLAVGGADLFTLMQTVEGVLGEFGG